MRIPYPFRRIAAAIAMYLMLTAIALAQQPADNPRGLRLLANGQAVPIERIADIARPLQEALKFH